MDNIDMQIINILEEEGRVSHEEISKRLNISRPAIHNRVNKLEELKIITGYKVTIDYTKIDYTTNAIVSLRVKTTNYDNFLSKLKNIQVENLIIEECHMVTGTWCILMKVRAKTPLQIKTLHDVLFSMEGVKEASTALILSSLYSK